MIDHSKSLTKEARIKVVQDAFPEQGLFRGKEWRISPDAFRLERETFDKLGILGNALHAFNRACNRLYFESSKGIQPTWIADLLDKGKPRNLVEYSRQSQFLHKVPSIIRPDIIFGQNEFFVTELDSLPGGVGVTAWMNKIYSQFDSGIVGGEYGVIDGFAQLLAGGDVIISKEAQDYKPEMLWLTEECRTRTQQSNGFRVIDTWNYSFDDVRSRAYRYFELWDLDNVENSGKFMQLAGNGEINFTPPFKPIFEEKLWLALFWSVPLKKFWSEALDTESLEFLRSHIPYGWVVDPTPVPPFGQIPRLDINSWEELGGASQKERQLVLKISGFSALAWGSRGVFIGHDLPGHEWKAQLSVACEKFDSNPYILQEFKRADLVYHPYYDPASDTVIDMQGRVRLCPYYFVQDDQVKLTGIMATICPSDKKLIHGMRDSIIVPCTLSGTL